MKKIEMIDTDDKYQIQEALWKILYPQLRTYTEKHPEEASNVYPSLWRIIEQDLTYLTKWMLQPTPLNELRESKALIGFSFGYGPAKIENPAKQYDPKFYFPGKSNEAMADIIKELEYDKIKEPLYVQWEIAAVLEEKYSTPVHYIAQPDVKYLGTKGVLEMFINKGGLNPREHNPIILVAHPLHVPRCLAIINQVDPLFQVLIADTLSVPFDPRSVQSWTRSLIDWINYEVSCRFKNRYEGNIDPEL